LPHGFQSRCCGQPPIMPRPSHSDNSNYSFGEKKNSRSTFPSPRSGQMPGSVLLLPDVGPPSAGLSPQDTRRRFAPSSPSVLASFCEERLSQERENHNWCSSARVMDCARATHTRRGLRLVLSPDFQSTCDNLLARAPSAARRDSAVSAESPSPLYVYCTDALVPLKAESQGITMRAEKNR
jgi:hypothetical protein